MKNRKIPENVRGFSINLSLLSLGWSGTDYKP